MLQVQLNDAYLSFNQTHKKSYDRICKVKLSNKNKILIAKSMLERYRIYKCCVFIDFEYKSLASDII